MEEHAQSAHSGLQLVNIKQASRACCKRTLANSHLTMPFQDPSWMSTLVPVYGGVPRLWRLTKSDGAEGIEEVVASIQGIICKKDLPPFLERMR